MKGKFRGIWIPVEVWSMFLKKELSATELHLLATIDSLVSPKEGCFASNKYLAEILGVRPDYIARLISKLKKKKLISQVRFDGRRRYLETVWSRIEELDRMHNADLENSPMPPSPLGKVDKKAHTKSGFGFVIEEDNKPEPFDKSSAIQLQTTLPPRKRKRQIPKSWPEQFRLLRTEDEHTKEEIEIALDWYCENFQDKWTPKCYTPKIFREKFDRVVAAMKRSETENPTVEISDDAERIVERLKAKIWPKGSERQLPQFVQSSLDQFSWFRSQVVRQANQLSPACVTNIQERMRITRHKNLLVHLGETLPSPSRFVETWFNNIWKRINGWDAWNGNLAPLSLDVNSTEFEKHIVGIIINYGRDPKEANEILTEMKNESDEAGWIK